MDQLTVMRGCEWADLRRTADITGRFGMVSSFLFSESISSEELLQAVKDGTFFGMMKVDVETPENVMEEYGHLNFPFVFKDVEITSDMLSPELLSEVQERRKKLPASYKTLCWNATGLVLATPLIQFYQRIGIHVKNVEWAVEHYESKPFTAFVDKLVNVRKGVRIKKMNI